MLRKELLVFVLCSLFVVILRIPSLDVPLDADSGANAFFARQLIRGEILYDRFHPTHHLPGIYYTFVAAFKLFGDSPMAPKLLLFPFMIAGVYLVYWIGRLYFNEFTGLLSALFYALTVSVSYLDGMTVQMELFANLPIIGVMFLVLFLLKRKAPAFQFFWVGVIGSLSILYKIVFVASLIASIISILVAFWLERYKMDAHRQLFLRLIWVSIGVALPLICIGGYFASLGLWHRLLLVFTLGFHYLGDQTTLGNLTFPKPFGFPLFMLAWNNLALLIFGLLGTYRLLRRSIPLCSDENVVDIAIVSWLISSLALAGLRGAGYPHYVLTTLPALALAAGAEINLEYQRWKITSSSARARLSSGLMIGLVLVLFLVSNNNLYSAYFPYKMGRISYQEFSDQILSFTIKDIGPVADYIATHTKKDDFIYVWSKSMQLYYFADRVPPIDIIWTSYISATGSPNRIFDVDTKYIIVSTADNFLKPQWLMDGLAHGYILETTIDEHDIYHRIEK